MLKYLKILRKQATELKIPRSQDLIQCSSEDKIRGRRYDQLLTLHYTKTTSLWAMEAVSLMIMKIQLEKGEFGKMECLKEATTPIILNSPVEHLPLYP